MLPGPIFFAELRTTARQGRYYGLRTFLGAVLLAPLWFGYSVLVLRSDTGEIPSSVLAGYVELSAVVVFLMQGSIGAVLTPALVAGAVAGERSRRTLDDLLASDLTSTEIIVGKLAARLLHVLLFLAVCLPISCLLTLLGGVDPAIVATSFAASAAGSLLVGGVTILASALARGPREAAFGGYAFVAAWLAIPPLIEGPILRNWPGLFEVIRPVERYLAMMNPFLVAPRGIDPILRMAGLMASLGIASCFMASCLLRPVARRQRGPERRERRRLWRHAAAPIGEDPMNWKERRSGTRRGPFGRFASAAFTLLAIGIILALARPAGAAFRETYEWGYGGLTWRDASEFNGMLRIAGTALYALGLLGAATAASGSITYEIESGTWLSLAASPLEGHDILRAKRAGSRRRARPVVWLLMGLWLVGLLSGAIHPFGFLLVTIATLVYFRFAVSLGTFISLLARSTGRAMLATVVLLIVLNVGYLICCLPLSPGSSLAFAGCTPLLIFAAPMSYYDMEVFTNVNSGSSFYQNGGVALLTGVLSIVFYGVGALALNVSAELSFERAVDRPYRSGPTSRRVRRDET